MSEIELIESIKYFPSVSILASLWRSFHLLVSRIAHLLIYFKILWLSKMCIFTFLLEKLDKYLISILRR